jgi:transposase
VVHTVTPATILGWHRKLVAQKFDGSRQRKASGRPKIDPELEALVVRLAQENRSWGYDRIVGALAHLGYTISAQTVGNILKRHGIPPAPERKTTPTWKEFVRTHMDVLVATDFFTTEVWTWYGLVAYYVLFFMHLGSRKVHVAGMTPHPDERWMVQVARNLTMEEWGFLSPGQYLIHDRNAKFCAAFQQIIDAAGVERVVRSCIAILRIIQITPKPGTMLHLNSCWRGQHHGLASCFLSDRLVRTPLALHHLAPHLAQAPNGGSSHVNGGARAPQT